MQTFRPQHHDYCYIEDKQHYLQPTIALEKIPEPKPFEERSPFQWSQLDRILNQEFRKDNALTGATITDHGYAQCIDDIHNWVEPSLQTYSLRRQAEDDLADYIEQCASNLHVAGGRYQFSDSHLNDLCDRMHGCRRGAAVGVKQDGGKIFAWDAKCSLVRLCPDESREESQRIAERYIPNIINWTGEQPNRRIYYAVLTDHNFGKGHLLTGKKYLFDKYKKFCNDSYIKERIKGSLIVQEDPLSAHDDWNIHLNAIFCVEGEFSYEKVRAIWGTNVHIRQVQGNIKTLTRTLLELVKYSAAHTGMKSQSEFDSGKSVAPPMTQWPHERWLEWWDAQRPESKSGKRTAFRRTRSYGCLYKIKYEPPKIDMNAIEWVGVLEYNSGWYELHTKNLQLQARNSVDLILDDNFSKAAQKEQFFNSVPEPPPDLWQQG